MAVLNPHLSKSLFQEVLSYMLHFWDHRYNTKLTLKGSWKSPLQQVPSSARPSYMLHFCDYRYNKKLTVKSSWKSPLQQVPSSERPQLQVAFL